MNIELNHVEVNSPTSLSPNQLLVRFNTYATFML